jgi:hypothetical protein
VFEQELLLSCLFFPLIPYMPVLISKMKPSTKSLILNLIKNRRPLYRNLASLSARWDGPSRDGSLVPDRTSSVSDYLGWYKVRRPVR